MVHNKNGDIMNTKNKNITALTALVIITAGAVIITILGISTVRGASVQPKLPTWTQIPADISNNEQVEIQSLKQDLQGELDEETRKSLEVKLQILSVEATQRALGVQQLTSMPNAGKNYIPPTFQIEGQRDTGIIEYPSSPFPSAEYIITNGWQELIDENYVTVFAGALTSNRKQGVLIVEMESPFRFRQYITPDQSGEIKISSAKGFRLVLVSSNNKTYYFDVPAQRFVNSLDEIVPTITPFTYQSIPTLTATPVSPYP
jgi:hypothetical protein